MKNLKCLECGQPVSDDALIDDGTPGLGLCDECWTERYCRCSVCGEVIEINNVELCPQCAN
jgi:hypothetical protein